MTRRDGGLKHVAQQLIF